jgi:hypothetical protein
MEAEQGNGAARRHQPSDARAGPAIPCSDGTCVAPARFLSERRNATTGTGDAARRRARRRAAREIIEASDRDRERLAGNRGGPVRREGCGGAAARDPADVFGDGHEVIGAAVLFRKDGSPGATAVPMTPLGNDRWQAEIVAEDVGAHHFTVAAWRDLFGTWHHDTAKKVAAGQDVSVEIEEARPAEGHQGEGRGRRRRSRT